MASGSSPSSPSHLKCCECGCVCSMMDRSLSGTYLRSVKRKYEEFEDEKPFTIPGLVVPQNARVEIENECQALRETVASQQQTIQELIVELEEERNASSSATSEAMSMILRLQREKAEVQMEARQFKRFVEEKMAHDQQETLALEDLLYKREQAVQSLTCEVEAYKHRMMSYGLTEDEANEWLDGDRTHRNTSMIENLESPSGFPHYEIYPSLKVNINGSQAYMDGGEEDAADNAEKYASGETPSSRHQLKDLEFRINQLEKNSPRTIQPDRESRNVLENVVVGHSPRRADRHFRKFSTDSSGSPFSATGRESEPDYSPRYGSSFRKSELSHLDLSSNLKKTDSRSETGDETDDRVYTIDSIHQGAPANGMAENKASAEVVGDEYTMTPRDSDLEIQKLYARLHALEADRESMRQAIISIGTDKAQLVLLKEIAQNLCKEMPPTRAVPLRKQVAVGSFSSLSIFRWITSFVLWRRKARSCKYMFGLSTNNTGLLILLDRGPCVGRLRHIKITST
ncbi:Myosin-binding protein 7 [Striga hermonthica]|uniref:Myosin-binding protein 7 n=1 Tax=Striga hermonthica TaxID=68872 RepID=A0A9N7P5B5_STRHE|nr:Myosin-binding protein 7 [Striga hermonthica]